MVERIEVAYESTSQEIKTMVENIESSSGMIVDSHNNKFKPILKGGFMLSDENDDMFNKLTQMFKSIIREDGSTVPSPVNFSFQPIPLENHKSIWLAFSATLGFIIFDINTFEVKAYTAINADDNLVYSSESKINLFIDENHFYIPTVARFNNKIITMYVYKISDLSFVKRISNKLNTGNTDMTQYLASGVAKSTDGKKYLFYHSINGTSIVYICYELTYTDGVVSVISDIGRQLYTPNAFVPLGISPDPSSPFLYAIYLDPNASTNFYFSKLTFSFPVGSGGPYYANLVTQYGPNNFSISRSMNQNCTPYRVTLPDGTFNNIMVIGGGIFKSAIFICDHKSGLFSVVSSPVANRGLVFDYENLEFYVHSIPNPIVYNATPYNQVTKYKIIETSSSPNSNVKDRLMISYIEAYRKAISHNLVPLSNTEVITPTFNSKTLVRDGVIYSTDVDILKGNIHFIKQTIGDIIIGYEEVK
ncbi:hypothetical protein [Lysinibacillus odysseyi]|uniref:Uncharacterized protein n=1 Tax=Lysinibacillus odysseyi 34hs-1 = NBRC 100172 TaxID=1220589 RepID=A0A0A3J1U7_9BACI|nr:hypothetical protein [Lysinibacillus odysseyi]KGR89153.1 hypothetical protein CD32_00600 [Lysinibacillus odysseyi 34hs-1 = NBRC 100172]